MKYSYAEKMAILEYARDNGTIAAARHFGVASSTVVRWNHKYEVYETQTMRVFSVEQKIEMLQYANEHGLTNAMNHYDIDTATLQKWNETLKVYKNNNTRHTNTSNKLPMRVSDTFKIRVLEYARDNGAAAASRAYVIAPSTIQHWNSKFRIYITRTHRTFSRAQKNEIIAYATKHSIADAARCFNVAGYQIQDWINKQPQK